MAVTVEQIAVAATAEALNSVSTSGLSLTIKNGSGALDLGPSSVTSGGGFSVAASTTVQVDLDAGDVLFGISDVTGTTVEVLST